MKTITRVEALAPGDKFYVGNDERTVERIEVVTPSAAAGLIYDDFRGSGPDYLRIWFEGDGWSSKDGVTHARLTYKEYPRTATVLAGEGL